ncbi:MAG: exonuclease SbcCD subunit D [Fulvimarina manganoxydans]|uniref:exonuclease SbcCD subunit D n=1 Tax=Fulvimarina manganoxydans TaxID=937218 RepID=UPI0023567247|nr:exonuclease SbcCD subunit D [Fulvimarina manganoxydans]MCK5931814.1 exonuclease SbcCD subunit D [Fulvimarina manganoxydans]
MRILHTADLHLGRQFNGISLDEDHQAALDQIEAAVHEHAVDVLVIAGDIFDRASPPAGAIRQFNGFLTRIASETEAAVVMMAGNHDSGDRIGSMAVMTDRRRALIRGTVAADEPPLVLNDDHGQVAFSALPFCYEYAARECFADETLARPEDVLAAQIAAARRHVPDGARWVIVAHAFVAGGEGSESERPLVRVGGIETVRPQVFAGAHYVALGHLHRPQAIGAAHIRYSGSPLAFGFDEANAEKSMCLVEMGAEGEVRVEAIPFSARRGVRVLTGRHSELLQVEPSDDFVKAILTDEAPVIDAMKRLRAVFPNACELTYAARERAPETKGLQRRLARLADPVSVAKDFVAFVEEAPMGESEESVVAAALDALVRHEDAA